MQLNPARGRKPSRSYIVLDTETTRFMQLNPARGRKQVAPTASSQRSPRFMQLNPARGRKLERASANPRVWHKGVYAAQPREGTETLRDKCGVPKEDANMVYAAQPREGTETLYLPEDCAHYRDWFMQLNPARGRKPLVSASHEKLFLLGLCSSTPRGDGNSIPSVLIHRPTRMVYAAQPREGTETTST